MPGDADSGMARVAEIEGVNIVLVGAFNPSIVQPAWLALKGLIKTEEAEGADVEIISRELVSFGLPESLRVLVTLDRCQIASAAAPSAELVRDLTVGILSVLPETPVSSMGINHNSHYRVADEELWNSFGHLIAPKEIWEGVVDNPGTRSLIIQGNRTDQLEGRVIVQVEPSVHVHPGIYISLNDHLQLDAMDKTSGGAAIEVLSEVWAPSLARAKAIKERLLEHI